MRGEVAAAGPDRRVDAVEVRECAVPEYVHGHVWWQSPDEEKKESGD